MHPGELICLKLSKLAAVNPADWVGEWSSPLRTTAAFSPRGRYQKRGRGIWSAFMSVIRLSSRRCCSSGLRDRDLVRVDPIRLNVAGSGAVEHVVGPDPDRTPSRSWLAQAGLPWRV